MIKHLLLTLLALAITLTSHAQMAVSSPTTTTQHAIYVLHPQSNQVLKSENADTPMGPASLTKLMTLYLTFDALKSGKITLETPVNVSEKAWRTGGSKMFIEVGKQVSVNDLIQGIAIVSGNDACIAIAEQLGGTEEGFAKLMNDKAAALGMTNTHFVNSSGLPDPAQKTTAKDIAILLTALFDDFPEYKHFLAMEEFTFNGIKQQNRNGLLHAGVGIDAGKTGHTEESGYHLASTAVQNGQRLVVVVMGTSGFAEREGQSLESYRTIFATHSAKTLHNPGDAVVPTAKVWHGTVRTTALTVKEPVTIFATESDHAQTSTSIVLNEDPIQAPAAADKPVGELKVTLANGQTTTYALYPAQAIDRGNFFSRLRQSFLNLFGL